MTLTDETMVRDAARRTLEKDPEVLEDGGGPSALSPCKGNPMGDPPPAEAGPQVRTSTRAVRPVPSSPSGRPGRGPPVPRPLRIIGWLLTLTALLGLLTVLALLATDLDQDEIGLLRDVSGRLTLWGRVTDENGTPLREVNLSVTGTPLFTLTDGNGEYRLENVSAGRVNLSLTKEGYTTVYFHTYLVPDDRTRLDLQLEAGSGARVVEDENYRSELGQARNLCSVLLMVLVLFTALGAYRSFQGRDMAWVAGGAIMGLFTFGFFVGSFLSGMALIICLRYRDLYTEGLLSGKPGREDLTPNKADNGERDGY